MTSKRPVYITSGTSNNWHDVCTHLGYAPLANAPQESGRTRVVRRDRFTTPRIDMEIEEIHHDW